MNAPFETEAGARDDAAYAAACGRVRALEKRLLGTARLEELLGSRDLNSLLRTLERFGVLPEVGDNPSQEWERALDLSGAQTDRLLLELDPRPTVSRILVQRADLVNLRSLMRAQRLGIDYEGPWLVRGLFERTQIEAMVRDGSFAAWPEPLARRLAELHRQRPEGLQVINAGLDAAWLGAFREGVRRAGSRFFLDWLGHAADLGNAGARLRQAVAPPSAWPASYPLLPGGHLGEEFFTGPGDAAAISGKLARTVYAPVVAQAADGAGGVSLARFERASDDFLTRLLRPARYLSLGPEPLWAWHLAGETDARNVRTLVLGFLVGLPPDRLRTLLRQPHVA